MVMTKDLLFLLLFLVSFGLSNGENPWHKRGNECFGRSTKESCLNRPDCKCMWCELYPDISPVKSTLSACGLIRSTSELLDQDLISRCAWNQTLCSQRTIYEDCKTQAVLGIVFFVILITSLNASLFVGLLISEGTNVFQCYKIGMIFFVWCLLSMFKRDRPFIPSAAVRSTIWNSGKTAALTQSLSVSTLPTLLSSNNEDSGFLGNGFSFGSIIQILMLAVIVLFSILFTVYYIVNTVHSCDV